MKKIRLVIGSVGIGLLALSLLSALAYSLFGFMSGPVLSLFEHCCSVSPLRVLAEVACMSAVAFVLYCMNEAFVALDNWQKE